MRKVSTDTTTRLTCAMVGQQAVGIRYVKACGTVSRRSIEIHAIWVDRKGNTIVTCWDRRTSSPHTFRLDRITHYALHRTGTLAAYRFPVVADTTEFVDPDTDEVHGFRSWSDARKTTS